MTPLGLANLVERNVNPEWANELRRTSQWNDIKQCGDLYEVKDKALSFAKGVPFFEGKTEQEIEEYTANMGRSLGFLD